MRVFLGERERERYKYTRRETYSQTDRERWRRKGWTFRKALKETMTQKLRRKREIERERETYSSKNRVLFESFWER